MRVLLFKIGALGDVLLTTPLVRALRRRFPAAHIDYLTGAWSAPVLEHNPHLNEIIVFDDKIIQARSLAGLLRIAAKIRWRAYDLVFVLDPGWQAQLLAAFFGGVQVRLRRSDQRIHDSEQYLTLGQQFGCETENPNLELARTANDERVAENFLKNLPHPRVAICPGGAKNPYQNMAARRWPPRYYAKLIRQLKSRGVQVVVLAGQKTSLAQTAAVIAQCDGVVTHDQGLMHVAATTTTPIIALFGPTDPQLKKPLGPQHRIMWKAAYPCHRHGRLENCTPAHDMHTITVAEVLETTLRLLPAQLLKW